MLYLLRLVVLFIMQIMYVPIPDTIRGPRRILEYIIVISLLIIDR